MIYGWRPGRIQRALHVEPQGASHSWFGASDILRDTYLLFVWCCEDSVVVGLLSASATSTEMCSVLQESTVNSSRSVS